MKSIQERVEKAINGHEAVLLFVDRRGDVDAVGVRDGVGDQDSVFFELAENAQSQGTYFPICTVVNGVIQDNSGDIVDIDELPGALKDAEAERVRFYSEREQEYGESAWPIG